METMASAKAAVSAGKCMATPAKAAAVATTTASPVSATSPTAHQDELTGVLLETVKNARLCDRGNGRKPKRTSANKGRD